MVVGHIGLRVVSMVLVDIGGSDVVVEIVVVVEVTSPAPISDISGFPHSYTGQHWSKPIVLQSSDGGGLHSESAQTISPLRH